MLSIIFLRWRPFIHDIIILLSGSRTILWSLRKIKTTNFYFASSVGFYHRLNMELDLQSLFGLLCTAELIGWDPETPSPPPSFGLICESAIGQPRKTTSLCDPLVFTYSSKYCRLLYCKLKLKILYTRAYLWWAGELRSQASGVASQSPTKNNTFMKPLH